MILMTLWKDEDGKFTTVPNGRRGRVCAVSFLGR